MNLDDTLNYLAALEPEYQTHTFYWSGLHPDGQRIQEYGTVEEMLPKLIQRNQQGYGIFTTINAMTPRYENGIAKRKATDVARVRAVVADWDDPNKPISLKTLPLEPSIVVETSPRKYHIYWLVDEMPLEVFEQAQRGIAQKLGTDRSIIDLSRELRVPGFMHTKDPKNPTPVKLKRAKAELRYSPLHVLEAFPYDIREAKAREVVQVRPKTNMTHAVVEALWGPMRPDGCFNVPCPWESKHTTKSNPTSTVYYPPSAEHGPQGYFKCMHHHCAERFASDFDEYVESKVKAAFK